MNKEFQIYDLQDLCIDIIDCPHTTPKWKDYGITVIRNYNIKDGKLDFSKPSYVDESTYTARTKRGVPEYNDLIISREAPMGAVALIPKNLVCCLGQRLVLLKINKEVCNPKYLLYVMQSKYVKDQIKQIDKTGSIVSNLNIGDLKKLKIPIIKEQEKVSLLLSKLDKKIETNNKINKNLEAQLQLLYDYWFTQFDFPDENNQPYQSSGGKMVWSDELNREIPEGWGVESIIKNSLSTAIKPGVNEFKTKMYYATADINGRTIGTGNMVTFKNRETRANMQPTINSVWFAKMKNSIKHLFLNKNMSKFINSSILSTGFCGIKCKENSFEYISSFISSNYFESIKDILSHGATQQAVNSTDMLGIKLIIPEEKILNKYHKLTKPMYAQLSLNICENIELAQLRDFLLPILMNGQAKIID